MVLLLVLLLLVVVVLVLLLVDVVGVVSVNFSVVGVVDPITCGGDGVSVIDVDCLSDC